MDDSIKKELQSAAFDRLVLHLRERKDVQNLDLMNLAGFCRNCLSKWYREEAQKKGINILGGAIGSKIGIGAAGGSTSKSSNTSSTQKTLTVVIKFKEKKIDTYTYNASTF